jgi:histidine phosphotransferase ChpT
VKLVLNLCLIALAIIPRGGVITVDLTGEGEGLEARVEANGPNARLAHGVSALIAGNPENNSVDAHSIQAFYTGLVGRSCGLDVTVASDSERVILDARAMVGSPAAAPA